MLLIRRAGHGCSFSIAPIFGLRLCSDLEIARLPIFPETRKTYVALNGNVSVGPAELKPAHQEQHDQNDQDQSARTVVVAATCPAATAEGEDQKDDQDNSKSAYGERATCEFHADVALIGAYACQSNIG
jgi:hypothetical protein